MGYYDALKAAGANLKGFKYYGQYQGIWVAHLADDTYIMASYGSCSSCDSYQDELGDLIDGPSTSQLASFGKSYLNLAQTKEQLIKELEDKACWNDDAEEILYDLRNGEI